MSCAGDVDGRLNWIEQCCCLISFACFRSTLESHLSIPFIHTIYSLLRSVLDWPLAVPCFEAALIKSSVLLLEEEYLDKMALVISVPVHVEPTY